MGARLTALVDRIREAKGPFFVARLNLRVSFPLARPDLPDSSEYEEEILDVCRSLGFDASALRESSAVSPMLRR